MVQPLHRGSTRRGIECLEQAITCDPQYALAHAGLALAWTHLGDEPGGGAVKPAVAYQRAKAAVTKALALDSGLGEAHALLGLLKFVCDFDWTGAEAEFRLALGPPLRRGKHRIMVL